MQPRIEVIVGGMRSGKTEFLNGYIGKMVNYGGKTAQIFKPDLDRRFSDKDVNIGRDGTMVECSVVPSMNPEYILTMLDKNADYVGIDEAQFFGERIVDTVQKISDMGIGVIITGLDMDSDRNPFGYIPQLMAIADNVTKLKSICECCGELEGIHTYANFKKDSTVKVGDKGYMALCRSCYNKKSM